MTVTVHQRFPPGPAAPQPDRRAPRRSEAAAAARRTAAGETAWDVSYMVRTVRFLVLPDRPVFQINVNTTFLPRLVD